MTINQNITEKMHNKICIITFFAQKSKFYKDEHRIHIITRANTATNTNKTRSRP